MKNYIIKKVSRTPDWESLPVLALDTPYLQTQADTRAWAQICCDEAAFQVHMWIETPVIRAVEQGPLGMPCEDSCLEFFFQPVAGDPRYINMEFNSNGCLFLGMGTGIEDLIRLLPLEETSQIFCPEIRMIPGGWEIFYRIPYSFIRQLFPTFAVQPEMQLRANCYACSDLTQPHYYLSWNPVATDRFTFHRSSCFGNMIINL